MISNSVFIILYFGLSVKADIIGHVLTLDYCICKSVESPQIGEESKLSTDLFQLYVALDEIHDMLRDERERGKSIVQQILNGGGLKLPKLKPNFPTIMQTFNWTVDESKVFGVSIKDTVTMWKNIEIGMETVPTTEIDYALNPDKG